jgi:plasmid stabilization system protein ParE
VNYVIRPAGRQDILRQFQYYIDQNVPHIGFRFIEGVDKAIHQLLEMPHLGAPKISRNPVLKKLRSWPVHDFEDVRIYYSFDEDTLRIIRILHGRRDVGQILEDTID